MKLIILCIVFSATFAALNAASIKQQEKRENGEQTAENDMALEKLKQLLTSSLKTTKRENDKVAKSEKTGNTAAVNQGLAERVLSKLRNVNGRKIQAKTRGAARFQHRGGRPNNSPVGIQNRQENGKIKQLLQRRMHAFGARKMAAVGGKMKPNQQTFQNRRYGPSRRRIQKPSARAPAISLANEAQNRRQSALAGSQSSSRRQSTPARRQSSSRRQSTPARRQTSNRRQYDTSGTYALSCEVCSSIQDDYYNNLYHDCFSEYYGVTGGFYEYYNCDYYSNYDSYDYLSCEWCDSVMNDPYPDAIDWNECFNDYDGYYNSFCFDSNTSSLTCDDCYNIMNYGYYYYDGDYNDCDQQFGDLYGQNTNYCMDTQTGYAGGNGTFNMSCEMPCMHEEGNDFLVCFIVEITYIVQEFEEYYMFESSYYDELYCQLQGLINEVMPKVESAVLDTQNDDYDSYYYLY